MSGSKTLDLSTATRKQLVEKIQNQRQEIILMAQAQRDQLIRCASLRKKLDRIRKVMKAEFGNRCFD